MDRPDFDFMGCIFRKPSTPLESLSRRWHLIWVTNNAGPVGRDGAMSKKEACSCDTALFFAEEISRLVAEPKTARVVLVGSEHIELLLQLAHRDFGDVTCCAALAGPSLGASSADIIVAPAIDREQQLRAFLCRLQRALRPDGVLLLGTAASRSTMRARLHKLLAENGLAFVRKHIGEAHLYLLHCRNASALRARGLRAYRTELRPRRPGRPRAQPLCADCAASAGLADPKREIPPGITLGFCSIAWMPLLPSTSWVTRRSTARLQNI
jgi:hypothetical protein